MNEGGEHAAKDEEHEKGNSQGCAQQPKPEQKKKSPIEDDKTVPFSGEAEIQKDAVGGRSNRKETNEGQQMSSQHSDAEEEGAEEICPEFFGVRSYLHNFYESMSVKNPQLYEDIYEDDPMYPNRSQKRKHISFCWRLFLIVGGFMLLLGLVFLFFGYLTPRKDVVAGYQEDIEIIDRDAIDFNNNLNFCRVLGLAIFCSGGGLFCATLLLPVISNIQYEDDDCGGLGGSDELLDSFRVVLEHEESPPATPMVEKIPAMEELASVQPKRDEDEEVVMTNAGLCKAPVPKKSPE